MTPNRTDQRSHRGGAPAKTSTASARTNTAKTRSGIASTEPSPKACCYVFAGHVARSALEQQATSACQWVIDNHSPIAAPYAVDPRASERADPGAARATTRNRTTHVSGPGGGLLGSRRSTVGGGGLAQPPTDRDRRTDLAAPVPGPPPEAALDVRTATPPDGAAWLPRRGPEHRPAPAAGAIRTPRPELVDQTAPGRLAICPTRQPAGTLAMIARPDPTRVGRSVAPASGGASGPSGPLKGRTESLRTAPAADR